MQGNGSALSTTLSTRSHRHIFDRLSLALGENEAVRLAQLLCIPMTAVSSPQVTLTPRSLARAVCVLSSISIVAALLLTHYMPKRFRIHPTPYLSDAGLRDPERIVFSFGLGLSAALFVPVTFTLHLSQRAAIANSESPASLRAPAVLRPYFPRSHPAAALPVYGLRAGLSLSFFLALFTAIPGWFFFHHIFAAFFAVSAAVWSASHTLLNYALYQRDPNPVTRRRIAQMFSLTVVQGVIIAVFAVVWLSIKAAWPYRMIPNKDVRFIYLALLEYVGTASFIVFIWMVSGEVSPYALRLSLAPIEAAGVWKGLPSSATAV